MVLPVSGGGSDRSRNANSCSSDGSDFMGLSRCKRLWASLSGNAAARTGPAGSRRSACSAPSLNRNCNPLFISSLVEEGGRLGRPRNCDPASELLVKMNDAPNNKKRITDEKTQTRWHIL